MDFIFTERIIRIREPLPTSHCSDMLNSGNMWIAPRRDDQRLRGDYIQTLERHLGGDLDIKVEHPYRGEMKWCFRPLLCTLLRLNWAKQTPGIMRRN